MPKEGTLLEGPQNKQKPGQTNAYHLWSDFPLRVTCCDTKLPESRLAAGMSSWAGSLTIDKGFPRCSAAADLW